MTCSEKQLMGGFWEDQIAGRCKFPIAPVNTITNLAYVIAGLGVWNLWGLAGKVFAIQLIFLGLASGLYHGFKTKYTSRLDNAGMYLVYGGLAVFTLAPLAPWTPAAMIIIGGLLAWRFAFVDVPDSYENLLLGTFLAIVLLWNTLNHHLIKAVIVSVIFGVAYLIWTLDRRKQFKVAPRLGHGIWHCLTALGTYLLFNP